MVSSRPAAAFCVEGELSRGGGESRDSMWRGGKTRSAAEYGLHLKKVLFLFSEVGVILSIVSMEPSKVPDF